jgi:outer membrane lipoprotein-sorting protein
MRFPAVFLLSAASVAWTAEGPSLDSTLNRMDTAAAAFRAVTAGLRKVSHTAIINEDNVESGVLYLKRPRPHEMKMLIELVQPEKKSVAVAGRTAEIYFPKMNTVQQYDIGKSRELLDQFFLVGFGSSRRDLETAYSIKLAGPAEVNGRKTALLELIPRSKEVLAHLKRFEVWVAIEDKDAGYPVQQKFHTGGGDYILAMYKDLKINPPLADTALKLHLPKDVKREFPQK